MKNKKLARYSRLFAVGGILLAVLIPGYQVAMQYSQTINTALKCETVKIVQGNTEGVDTNYFPSTYTTAAQVKARAEELCREVEGEGLVLLKNNDALPFAPNAKISCFAQGSVNLNYSASGSSATDTGSYDNLKTALESNGFQVNNDLWNWYSGNSYKRTNSTTGLVKTYLVNEAPWSEVMENCGSSFETYGDVALVVFSRDSGEGFDASTKGSDGEDGSYLSITPEEEELLVGLTALKASNTFKKIVVLLNGAVPMELDFLYRDGIDVDACMWIGNLGMSGVYGVTDVLAGTVNPSGRLSDTFCKDNFSSPAMKSWIQNEDGLFSQAYVNPNGYELNVTQQNYGVYVEGIYVGYRYYETRYEDYVLGTSGVGEYDYFADVAFPFGYGLSYTQFAYTDYTVIDKSANEYEVSVTVENVGATPGKEVVQIYLQKPYNKADQLEVASVELAGFAKTDVLEVGETQTVTISVLKEQLKCYDADIHKTYVQPAGDYLLTVAKDAHDAINNVLAFKGKTVENTDNKMTANGNSMMVKNVLQLSAMDTTYYERAVETKNKITNLLDEYDINKYSNKGSNSVTYVSRSNWLGTMPTSNVVLTLDNAAFYADLGSNKEITDNVTEEITYGASNGLNTAALRGLEYENLAWGKLLDQMTFQEQSLLLTNAAWGTSLIESVGAFQTKATDGPTGVINSITASSMPGEGIWASSFNVELIEKIGDIIAEDARINDITTMYAPGVNLHRTPFGGRANEYFSEDSYLTGMAAVAEVKGMQNKGVIPVLKHFAFNDEESARNGISIWLNEQSARELYLLPFEYAMRPSIGCAYGAMSSFNRAGAVWVGASSELQIDIARGEWDFQGYFLTDMAEANGKLYMVYSDGIYNGTDLFLGNGSKTALNSLRNNKAFQQRVREAAHRVMYVNTNFNAIMNGKTSDTKQIPITPWWQLALISILVVVAVYTLIMLGLWCLNYLKKSKR